MRIVQVFIKRSAALSAGFLFVLSTGFLLYQLLTFTDRLQTQLIAESTSAASVAAQQYGFGDLVALRSSLDSISKNRRWHDANFTDSTGAPMWHFTSEEHEKSEDSNIFEKVLWKAYSALYLQSSAGDYILATEVPVQIEKGFQAGRMRIEKNIYTDFRDQSLSLLQTLLIFAVFWSLYITLNWYFARVALSPLVLLGDELRAEAERLNLNLRGTKDEDELQRIRSWFKELASSWKDATERAIRNERLIATAHLAQQVAHDIRSPLTALSVVERDLAGLGEENRILVRGAINRIRDIANHLLDKNGGILEMGESTSKVTDASSEQPSTQLLSSMIERVIAEKRLRVRSQSGIEIEFDIGPSSYGFFSRVQTCGFMRVVSNLIDNSVEALEGTGRVSILLEGNEESVSVVVMDNGKGISTDILPKLLRRGATYGKSGGSGLGLFHAKSTIEAWGGSIDIKSIERRGTSLRIVLPRAATPAWFLERIELSPNAHVVVLDDDSSIHQVWDRRFDSIGSQQHGFNIVHCLTSSQIRDWLNQNPAIWDEAVYLVDYELLNTSESGLDVVETLGIQSRSILVSSRFDEPEVLDRCVRLGVKVVPKMLAGFVPISFE